ncbi:MAG: FUSC family protein [Alphaproteobacteria bacterium]|nr:FUSC family protein [Alphaproteobacteria bacterium]
MLSRRAKEAIKTGAAMTIAYGVALSMNWEKPQWAAIAVAVISLSSIGHSVNKGVLRMVGTLLGCTAALFFIGLFPQDRWLLMTALSVYLGFCAYMTAGKSYPYFWFCSAFVAIVIIVSGDAVSERTFQLAIERTLETGLGVLVYSLIAVFVWPQSSRSDLQKAGQALVATQRTLFQAYRAVMVGDGKEASSRPARLQEVQQSGQLSAALAAAETDSYTVWEARRQWRRLCDDAVAFGEALERWRESFPEVRGLDVEALLPGLQDFNDEIERRLASMDPVLSGDGAPPEPRTVSLTLDEDKANGVSHIQRAALTVTKAQLDRLETLSRDLVETIRDIRGAGPSTVVTLRPPTESPGLVIDIDRLISTVRVILVFWVGFLIWVYVDPPGHAGFTQQATIYALVIAMMAPLLTARMLLAPYFLGCMFAGLIYIFIMPHLSGFLQLGTLIFVVIAGMSYLFAAPQMVGVKMAGYITFIVIIGVKNEQSYDFVSFASTSTMMVLAVLLNIVMAYFPTSSRNEKIFLRLFKRFLRQVDFLLSRIVLDWERTAGFSGRFKARLYSHGLLALARKIAWYGQKIDCSTFPDVTPEKIEALAANIAALAFRVNELVDSRRHPQSEFIVQELLGDFRAWRLAIQDQIRLWFDDPEAAARQAADLQARVSDRLALLEARIEETIQHDVEGVLTAQDRENLYRVLGAFRGISEAGLGFIGAAREVHWGQLKEARF